MNDIRFVYDNKAGHACLPNGGSLYINGQLVKGVLEIKPNLVAMDEVATVTLTLVIHRFVAEAGEADEYKVGGTD